MKRMALTFPTTFAAAPPDTGGLIRRADRLADITARAGVIVLFSLMAMRLGADFVATGRLPGCCCCSASCLSS